MKIRIKFDGGKLAKPSGKFKDLNKLGAAPVGLLELKERGFAQTPNVRSSSSKPLEPNNVALNPKAAWPFP